MDDHAINLTRAAIQQLESLRRAGVRQIPARPRAIAIAASDEVAAEPKDLTPPPVMEVSMPRPATSASRPAAKAAGDLFGAEAPAKAAVTDQAGELEILSQQVAGCMRCAELAATRTQTVFGVGNPSARLVFFGEAPGADEDRQGEPFVGRAGQQLTDIIQKGMKLKREDVYILNTLKCRPPNNRNPELQELSNCRPFWQRQLEIIAPQYIVCLGRFAMQEVLQTAPTVSVGKMRGRFHDYAGAKVVVTYHPSYLLRNPAAKKDVWEDIKMLMREMGIEIEGK
jgi:DNA polymerase